MSKNAWIAICIRAENSQLNASLENNLQVNKFLISLPHLENVISRRKMKSKILAFLSAIVFVLYSFQGFTIQQAWITTQAPSGVTVINNENGVVIKTIPSIGSSNELASTGDGSLIFVTQNGLGTVAVYNTNTLDLQKTIPLAKDRTARPIGISIIGDEALVTTGIRGFANKPIPSQLWVISIKLLAALDSEDIPGQATLLAVNPVSYFICTPDLLEIQTHGPDRFTRNVGIYLGVQPTSITLSPNGQLALVCSPGLITFLAVPSVDFGPSAIVATVPLVTGAQPQKAVFTPDGRFAYVTDKVSNSVYVIDATAFKKIQGIPVGINPIGIAITKDGKFVSVCNSSQNTITKISTANMKVVNTFSFDKSIGNPLNVVIVDK